MTKRDLARNHERPSRRASKNHTRRQLPSADATAESGPAMRPLTALRDWLRYQRLHHYPELAGFPREQALLRLEHYHREEAGPGDANASAVTACRVFPTAPVSKVVGDA